MTHPDDLRAARERMIEQDLRRRGIADPRVLQAMAEVPREAFLPEKISGQAYDDAALPIACRQTISQPYIVALMTESLNLSGDEHVLEIGAGSGYQAAILGRLAARVTTIERHRVLAERAGATLARLGCDNVEVKVGDGTLGWSAGAPYDRIMVTAAADQVPAALLDQLAEAGRLIAPVGPPESQMLRQIDKEHGRLTITELTPCRFVPLIADPRPSE